MGEVRDLVTATVSSQVGNREPNPVAEMVKLIGQIGPKIPEVARRIGRHKETVRYWYRKLEERGFAVQGMLNHEALGLKRIVLKARFADLFEPYVKSMMFALNEICYVVSFAKTIPDGSYIINGSVPAEHVAGFLELFSGLKEKGVLKSVEFFSFDWVRNPRMKADLYDFENGLWDIDWSALPKIGEESAGAVASERTKFDRLDLLILKELQIDATRGLQEIHDAIRERDGVDINYKTLCWHLKEHVEGNGLLKGYAVRWMGTKYDPVSDKVRQRQHSFMGMDLLVRDVSESERLELIGQLNRLPFLWAEAAGRDYFAELAIPGEMLTEGLEYIQAATKQVSERSLYNFIDQKNAVFFTFSYNLFDSTSRSWRFNKEELLGKFVEFERLIKKE